MNPVLYQSQLDAHLSWTYEGYNNNLETTSSFEGLSLQKRLLYWFLCLYRAEYRHRDMFYQI